MMAGSNKDGNVINLMALCFPFQVSFDYDNYTMSNQMAISLPESVHCAH